MIALAVAAVWSASAAAERPLATGFADPGYRSADSTVRGEAFDKTIDVGGRYALHFVSWRETITEQPVDPTSPADPAYAFSNLDAIVTDAVARGLVPLLDVSSAPDFAVGADPPPGEVPGTWRPDPVAFGQFGEALAARYSGDFTPAGAGAPLPRVKYFQAWAEPNLTTHLSPQYVNGQLVGPELFRGLLNNFYAGVKRVHSDNVVVTGGTAPYGDPPGATRTRPLVFWREVLCLSRKLDPRACPSKANFDVFAHNAINTSGGPTLSAIHPDDASTPDLKNLRRILRASEAAGLTAPASRHPVWVTDLWWETNPPDSVEGIPPRRQASLLALALNVLWEQGAEVVINLHLRDQPFDSDDPLAETSTGLLFADGSKKPSYTAFRFPLVAERAGKRRLEVWGRAPTAGRLAIQRKGAKRWVTVRSRIVDQHDVFSTKIPGSGAQKVRAKIGRDASMPWTVR